MLDKLPLDAELGCEFGGEGFDAEDLGGVVTAGVEVEPELLRHVEVMLAKLASDESVDVVGKQMGHGALAAAGEDADALGLCAAVFDRMIRFGEENLQLFSDFGAATSRAECDGGDVVALVVEEGVDLFEAECFGEEGVIADLGMAIERQVRAIHSEVAFEGGLYLLSVGSGEWYRGRPEEAVVADEEIDAFHDGRLESELASIHAGTDFGDATGVFDLQPVVSALEVFYFDTAGALIAKSDDVLKLYHVGKMATVACRVKIFLCGRF